MYHKNERVGESQAGQYSPLGIDMLAFSGDEYNFTLDLNLSECNADEFATFYENVINYVINAHINPKTDVTYREMAQAAMQYVLQATAFKKFIDPKTNEYTGDVELDSKDNGNVTAIRLSSGEIIRDRLPNKEINSLKEQADYLYPDLKKISDSTGLGMQDLFDLAINGALLKLTGDDHTSFMRFETKPDFFQAMQGRMVGIGIHVIKKQKVPMLGRVLEDSAADKAGLKKGDLLLSIDGVDVRNYALDDITKLLRGKEGVPVALDISRDGQTISDIKIKRASVDIKPVKGRIIRDNIAHVTIDSFSEKSAEAFYDCIDRLQKQAADNGYDQIKLILDVRGNGGGHTSQVTQIADAILSAKMGEQKRFLSMSYARSARGNARSENYYTGDYALQKFDFENIFLLQDPQSASASEILAGALQDAGVKIIGQRSMGKGSMQTTQGVNEKGRLVNQFNEAACVGVIKVTQAIFFPGASSLTNQGCGVQPAIRVEYGDFRDKMVRKAHYEDNENTSLVPDANTRKNHRPGYVSTLDPEYSGELTEEQIDSVPDYLVDERYKMNKKTRELEELKIFDADMATALCLIDGGSDYIKIIENPDIQPKHQRNKWHP